MQFQGLRLDMYWVTICRLFLISTFFFIRKQNHFIDKLKLQNDEIQSNGLQEDYSDGQYGLISYNYKRGLAQFTQVNDR